MGPSDRSIRFIMNGDTHLLSRDEVEQRLRGLTPDGSGRFTVTVNGKRYPVKQVLEAATGVPRDQFTTQTARRHLVALDYEIHGAGHPAGPDTPTATVGAATGNAGHAPPVSQQSGEWHTEANVQAAVVTALATQGWRILAVANTATKQHGIDVVAARGERTVGIEVKGFPSEDYADPAKAGQTKKTQPSTQAGPWYSQAVLAAMRLRTKEPGWASVIALPDFPRYQNLYEETRSSLDAAGITLWWVNETGDLTGP